MLVTGPSVRRPTDTLVQRRLLGNFSDQFDRGRVETCLLLFVCQILLSIAAAMREAVAMNGEWKRSDGRMAPSNRALLDSTPIFAAIFALAKKAPA